MFEQAVSLRPQIERIACRKLTRLPSGYSQDAAELRRNATEKFLLLRFFHHGLKDIGSYIFAIFRFFGPFVA